MHQDLKGFSKAALVQVGLQSCCSGETGLAAICTTAFPELVQYQRHLFKSTEPTTAPPAVFSHSALFCSKTLFPKSCWSTHTH